MRAKITLWNLPNTDRKNNLEFWTELHLVEYGTSKSECTAYENDFQVLIDDNKKVRNSWVLGNTINAKEDILPFLERLVNAYI